MRAFVVLAMFLVPALGLAGPRILPARDVTVNYTLRARGVAPAEYRLDYDAADQRARVTSGTDNIFVLVDLPEGLAQVIVPMLHAIVQAPDLSDLTQMIHQAGDARFTPLGRQVFAGIECQNYRVVSAKGSATACITGSGVILHFSGQDAQGSAEVTAQSVSFGPQPVENFTAPEGYTQIQLPPDALAALLRPQ